MLPNLHLADGERQLPLDFNCENLRNGRIIYDVYNPTGVLHAQIIALSFKAYTAAFVGLPGFTMQKYASQQILLNKTLGHRVGLVGNFRRGSNGTVSCLGITLAQPGLHGIVVIPRIRQTIAALDATAPQAADDLKGEFVNGFARRADTN